MPSGGLCSDWLRLRTVVNRVSLPTSVWTRQGPVPAAPSLCCVASSPRLAKGARPPTSLARRPGVVHHLSISPRVIRPLNVMVTGAFDGRYGPERALTPQMGGLSLTGSSGMLRQRLPPDGERPRFSRTGLTFGWSSHFSMVLL